MILPITRIIRPTRGTVVSSLFSTYNFPRLISHRSTRLSRAMSTNPASHDDLSSVFTDDISKEILDFWYEDIGPYPTQEQAMRWFSTNEEFDGKCRSKFAPLISKLATYPSSSIVPLATSPERALSLIILLDQFPRNIFRGDLSAKVYTETDPLAVSLSLHSISPSLRYDLGPNNAWKTIPSRRFWFSLPLSHSEDPELHRKQVEEILKEVVEDCKEEEAKNGESPGLQMANMASKASLEHKEVIDKFGRYPYRNKVLGRESTEEEKVWLEKSVGWAR